MKFRTDFVTNSSDSSFLTFNIQNKALFDCLTSLGIKFENVEGGFDDSMVITLPSGESEEIDGFNNWSLPYVTDFHSVSAWLVSMLLWEIEDVDPPKEEEEYSDFSRELIDIFNKADITHLDWEAVESWSRDEMVEDLEAKFGAMDAEMESAEIEHTYGFEGEVGPAIYMEVQQGQRMTVEYNGDIETQDAEDLRFVVTGKLRYFENREAIVESIEDKGGVVTESISKKTDYLICNDVESQTSKLKKAKALGIPVLSEAAFIRRFCDDDELEALREQAEDADDEFEGLKDLDDVFDEAWDLSSCGGVLDFVMDNGTQPVVMEIWKNGKWVANGSK